MKSIVINSIVRKLQLPMNEILFLHVKLKGINNSTEYPILFQELIDGLYSLYSPQTLLIPTFTYTFTHDGIYDRTTTPTELGRFSHEAFTHFGYHKRSMNPVFSVIDTELYFSEYDLNETTAFGKQSFFECISKNGFITININLGPDEIRLMPLHYLEYVHQVPYRYIKYFEGRVSANGKDFRKIQYEYFVRDLVRNPKWNRPKIYDVLNKSTHFHSNQCNGIPSSWMHSKDMEQLIGATLLSDPEFLIK